MSEKDLGLKVQSRLLLWRMGCTTRVDVPLRASIPDASNKRGGKARSQTYTDVDVLGYQIVGGSSIYTIIVDCKTSSKRATERIFWTRGVADLVAADEAWMVRLDEPPPVTRQLSTRLGIATLTRDQIMQLSELHPSELPLNEPSLGRLFDAVAVSEALVAFKALDSKLARLLDFRQFDYFVNAEHENLVQLVSHAAAVASVLNPHDPLHCSLFFDLVWLQLLSTVRAVEYIRKSHMGDLDVGLQEYLLGGQVRLAEKRELATILQSIAPEGSAMVSALPDYFPSLRETVIRLLKRPALALQTLRYAEVATATLAARKRTSIAVAFRDSFDPLVAKLVLDVAGYLVGAAQLDAHFRAVAADVMMGGEEKGHPE